MLSFSHSIDILDDMSIGISYSDLESNLLKTYKDKRRVRDGEVKVDKGKIDEVVGDEWITKPSGLTKGDVNLFGVKTFPGLGPYGFYTKNDKTSTVKLPIKRVAELPKVELLQLENIEDNVKYKIGGKVSTYDFIRLRLYNDTNEYDFILKPLEGLIPKPPNSAGVYNAEITGYKDEISKFSETINVEDFTIT